MRDGRHTDVVWYGFTEERNLVRGCRDLDGWSACCIVIIGNQDAAMPMAKVNGTWGAISTFMPPPCRPRPSVQNHQKRHVASWATVQCKAPWLRASTLTPDSSAKYPFPQWNRMPVHRLVTAWRNLLVNVQIVAHPVDAWGWGKLNQKPGTGRQTPWLRL